MRSDRRKCKKDEIRPPVTTYGRPEINKLRLESGRNIAAQQGCFEYSSFEYKYEYEYLPYEYEYEYEYRSLEYEYEYEYLSYEYEYEYEYNTHN